MSLDRLMQFGLSHRESKRILSGLSRYRGMRDSFEFYPDRFLEKLMLTSHDSRQLFLPLDVVELWPFLVGGKVFGDFLLFDIKFVRSQYKAYPVYAVLEIPQKELKGKGVFYTEDNDLLKYVKSFYINSEKQVSENVNRALKTIGSLSNYDTHTLVDIPIQRKEASAFAKKKYRIKIDSIHGDSDGEVVWADDVRDALMQVVKDEPEAEKILTMYYSDSPFVNGKGFEIAREANATKVVKEAKKMKKKAQATNLELNTTPNQAKILDFVKQGLERYGGNLQAWVVGGYVRDSLMGKESDDLDIALSSAATGLDFAQFLQKMGNPLGGESPTGKLYSTALDKTNTGSGDLQVAALDIYGEKIDFVNLRTEEYSETSRVPVQTITDDPAEDAQRRDLTINSLYYNIRTGQVEDYVGGLRDFEQQPDGTFKPKILRTPTDPKKTFMDDPLRMLRVLRFFSRYEGVQIDPNVVQAFQDPEVLAMYDKLAPERASKEVRKMMEGPQAVEAAEVLLNTGLYKKVFKVDEGWHGIDLDQQSPYHQFNLMEHTLSVMKNYNEIAKRKGVEGEERGLMLLATLLHDFGKMHPDIRKQKFDRKTGEPVVFDRNGEPVDRYSYEMHERESAKFTQDIMTQMGFTPEEKKFVTTVVEHHMLPHNFDKSMKDKTMGKFLNKVGDLYEHIMDHGEADALSKGEISDEERQQIVQQRQQNLQNLNQYRERMQDMVNRPMVNGNEVMALANSVAPELGQNKAMLQMKGYGKPAFYVKLIMDKLLEQQWSGNINDKVSAENFVRSYAKQLLNLWRNQQQEQALKNASRKAALKQAVKSAVRKEAMKNAIVTASRKAMTKEAQHLGFNGETSYLEGDPPFKNLDDGVAHLNRSVSVSFKPGDSVAKRGKGYNFKQEEGTVEKVENNIMTVKWKSGKRTKHSLNDPAKLFAVLEKK